MEETLKAINEQAGLGLTPMSLANPLDERAVAVLNTRPEDRAQWISAHRGLQAFRAVGEVIRRGVERLVFTMAALGLPAIILLPTIPWMVRVNYIVAAVMAYVTLLNLWAIVEGLFFHILGGLKVVYQKLLILNRATERDGQRYALVAWGGTRG